MPCQKVQRSEEAGIELEIERKEAEDLLLIQWCLTLNYMLKLYSDSDSDSDIYLYGIAEKVGDHLAKLRSCE